MSSHHFVKDQQEPAVFILQTEDILYGQVAPLLEWIPTIVVTEESLDQTLSWGIKIDVIVATEEFQQANLHLSEAQHPVKFKTSIAGKFLHDSLEYLLAREHFAAHLIGFAHQSALELKSKLDKINLTILDGDWKFFPVKSGKMKKWFAESTIHIHGQEGLPIEIRNSNGK